MGRRRRDDPGLCGVLLLDKPAGPTSHDVVAWVRWGLGVSRVGHCGTLDPAATGLLVVAVGAATKLAPYLTGQDKQYRARIVLGRRTDTADAQGQTLEQRPCPADLEPRVPAALAGLVGALQLPPPAYSAIHVDGKRAHELARAGTLDTLPLRPMTVHELQPGPVVRHGDRVEVEVTMTVSKGTYVRSLAEALGERLQVPAHLGRLHRLRSGSLSLSDPAAVSGLTAHARPPGPGGAPRWRIAGVDGPDADREAVGGQLRANLLEPAQVVPLPLLRLGPGIDGERALRRLLSGQPVALHEAGLPEATVEAERLAVVPGQPGAPGLLVVRREGEGRDARLEPERVIAVPRVAPLTPVGPLHHSPPDKT